MLHTVSMTARALLLSFASMCLFALACVQAVNDGNACFINAIVQGLSACPSFYEWLMARKR